MKFYYESTKEFNKVNCNEIFINSKTYEEENRYCLYLFNKSIDKKNWFKEYKCWICLLIVTIVYGGLHTWFHPSTLSNSPLNWVATITWLFSALEVLIIPIIVAATLGQISQVYEDERMLKEYERLFIEKALALKQSGSLDQCLSEKLEIILKSQ